MWIDRRGLLAAVASSVLLNLFLLGAIGSHLFVEHRPVTDRALVPEGHVEALPSDQRASYVAAMKAHKPALISARRALQAARNGLEAQLAAPVFDGEKVKAAFGALRTSREALQEQTQAALTEALAGLPAASRAALVAR